MGEGVGSSWSFFPTGAALGFILLNGDLKTLSYQPQRRCPESELEMQQVVHAGPALGGTGLALPLVRAASAQCLPGTRGAGPLPVDQMAVSQLSRRPLPVLGLGDEPIHY